MIQSMTGYGKTVLQLSAKKITIELKSLNSKNLDINVRIPSYYREKELDSRNKIAKKLRRGKVDFFIYVEENGAATSAKINENVVREYMNQLKNLVDSDEMELLKMAVRLPDSLKMEKEELDLEEWERIDAAIDTTLEELTIYRIDEGKVLEKDFLMRISNIESLLDKIIEIDPQRVENVKDKIKKSIADLEAKIDQNRFEQELIYYIEKLDITEELVRLKNHLDYFLSELKSEESNGKNWALSGRKLEERLIPLGPNQILHLCKKLWFK